jgi:hypothetical protein
VTAAPKLAEGGGDELETSDADFRGGPVDQGHPGVRNLSFLSHMSDQTKLLNPNRPGASQWARQNLRFHTA